MPLSVGVGYSQKSEPEEAAKEALKTALLPLKKQKPDLIIAFASPTKYNQTKLINAINSANPDSEIIGCSTSGEISNFGSTDGSVVIMALHSKKIRFITGLGENIKEDPRESGRVLAKNIIKKGGGKPQAIIMLPDGLAGNGADIVRGVLDIAGSDIKLAGGAAGDDFLFKKTYEYLNGQIYTGAVVGVGLYGSFNMGIGVKHGWIPIGNPRTVTKSKSNVVYEFDNKPAIQMYEDQFGKDKTVVSKNEPFARLAITYPLGILIPGKDEYLIRDPLSVDDHGEITCAAEIPKGSQAYIMIGSVEEAISAAEDAAERSLRDIAGKAEAVLIFNCIARKKLLMNKKQEEIDRIMRIIGKNVPLAGFYTYGEQAPLGGEITTCSFHNETDVIVSLSEK